MGDDDDDSPFDVYLTGGKKQEKLIIVDDKDIQENGRNFMSRFYERLETM